MRNTYILEAGLGSASEAKLAPVLSVAYRALDTLAVQRSGTGFSAAARLHEDFSLLPAGSSGPRFECLHDRDRGGARLAGLRYEGPPDGSGAREIRIEVVVRSDGAGPEAVAVGVRVYRPAGSSFRAESAPPPPVAQLAERFGFRVDGVDLSLEPRTVGEAKVASELVPLIADPARTVPVLVCSPLPLTGRPILDTGKIQRLLVGIAPVYELASTRATFPLANLLGRPFACYDGAVRIYYPGFAGSAPGEHTMWRPAELLGESDFAAALIAALTLSGRRRTDRSELRWERLADAGFRRTMESLGQEESLKVLREREHDLMERISILEAEVDAERDRSRSLATTVAELRERLLELEPDLDTERPSAEPAETAETVVQRVVMDRPDRLVLALNGRSELEDSPFQDLAGLENAMHFLATTYWEARFDGLAVLDLDRELRDVAPGFRYNAHQSTSTIGRFPEDYVTVWDGRRYELRAHIARGTGRDARHTIRIAFAVDAERRSVVIGFIGQHQRTTAS